MIIFLAGVHGIGKSTLIEHLKREFKGNDKICFIRERYNKIKQKDICSFFRKEHYERENLIKKALQEYKIIICDRIIHDIEFYNNFDIGLDYKNVILDYLKDLNVEAYCFNICFGPQIGGYYIDQDKILDSLKLRILKEPERKNYNELDMSRWFKIYNNYIKIYNDRHLPSMDQLSLFNIIRNKIYITLKKMAM